MQQVEKILIGQISVDSKADWDTLRDMIFSTFKVRYMYLLHYLIVTYNTVLIYLLHLLNVSVLKTMRLATYCYN